MSRRVLLDANVLYPTVMREVLMGAAQVGLFVPLFSRRILEEWALAARRLGEEQEVQARAEITLICAAFPRGCVEWAPSLEARLWLPDGNDVHVLAAAIAGSADLIVTENAKDFPRNVLREEGLERESADPFLCQLWTHAPEAMVGVAERVRQKAEALSGEAWTLRKLLRKARLPRLGKALERSVGERG